MQHASKRTSEASGIKIDIVSDIVCPWCAIGYYRLKKALDELELTACIKWHPFELNPGMPPEGQNLRKHLAKKYGTQLQQSIQARRKLTQLGAEVGFTFNYFDEMKMVNTFTAHQLLHFAREYGLEHTLKLRFFEDYFASKKALNEDGVLIQSAVEVGLPEDEVKLVLETNRYEKLVRDEMDFFLNQGIRGVPFFLIDGTYSASGAQEVERFKSILNSVLNRRQNNA